ncbi:MAG: amidohydrolase [Elusimicrobiota bacterium]
MPEKYADTALTNAHIYSRGKLLKGSLLVTGKRVFHITDEKQGGVFCGPGTRVVDLKGGLILPGFHDAHMHSSFGSLFRKDCDLAGLNSEKDYLEAITLYAAAHRDKPCVRGSGWHYGAFGRRGPAKASLDAVVPDIPAMLTAADGHAVWVNSKALELAGINKNTPSPAGGIIERDPNTGEPSGTLRELSAIKLALDALPSMTPDELTPEAAEFLQLLAANGICGIHDAALTPDVAGSYSELDAKGLLTSFVSGAFLCEPGDGKSQVQEFIALRDKFAGKHFTPRAVKIFLDGVVEGHTAFLLEPYCDLPGERGQPAWTKAGLEEAVAALDHAGFQIHIHAIGDAAVRMALDAFEDAAKKNGPRDSRHIIAHLELVHEADMPRFRELGVIANFQPVWFYLDTFSDSLLVRHLGKKRAGSRFKIRSLLEAGAVVTCGSDWPVGGDFISLNPLDSIQIGVTRRGTGARSAKAYMPEEIVTLRTMMDCWTFNGAYADFREKEAGSLEDGKLANLAVLDKNIFDMPADEIHRARVTLTMFEGKIVFRKAGTN